MSHMELKSSAVNASWKLRPGKMHVASGSLGERPWKARYQHKSNTAQRDMQKKGIGDFQDSRSLPHSSDSDQDCINGVRSSAAATSAVDDSSAMPGSPAVPFSSASFLRLRSASSKVIPMTSSVPCKQPVTTYTPQALHPWVPSLAARLPAHTKLPGV